MSADQQREETPSSPEIHFEPIVSLSKVDIKTLEENEEEMVKMRAKLFRYIIGQHDSAPEWKERGIGEVKILKNRVNHSYRLVMRREKTLKVCANHFLNKDMELKPNCGSDRAWVWNVSADYADEEPRKETLAIRFANAESAKKFKEAFDKCKEKLDNVICDVESEKLAIELESLKVKDANETTETEQKVKQDEHKDETAKEVESCETQKQEDETQEQDETPKQEDENNETEEQESKDETEKATDNDKPSDSTVESATKESEGQ